MEAGFERRECAVGPGVGTLDGVFRSVGRPPMEIGQICPRNADWRVAGEDFRALSVLFYCRSHLC